MEVVQTFNSIQDVHTHFLFPGISNRRYIYDSDGMIRVYSIPDYSDLFEKDSITFWMKEETMGKHFKASMKQNKPIHVIRKTIGDTIEYLGTWFVHTIEFSYVLLKKEEPI